MESDLCPSCGAARTGSFRFCRTCGLDYDSPVPSALTPASGTPAPAPQNLVKTSKAAPTDDVIVIQVRHLKLWFGAIVGGLIGAMLAGAIVVPLFGQDLVLFASVAGLATIVGSAWLGWRFVQLTTRRSPHRS